MFESVTAAESTKVIRTASMFCVSHASQPTKSKRAAAGHDSLARSRTSRERTKKSLRAIEVGVPQPGTEPPGHFAAVAIGEGPATPMAPPIPESGEPPLPASDS